MSFYITTPIYYVNAQPHLGHAYTSIAADVIARHMRQRGEDVFSLTGTDEHGEPVADAARAQGLEPKDLADRNAERFKALVPQLKALQRLLHPDLGSGARARASRRCSSGSTTTATRTRALYEGWYCPRCADFKVENEILDGNRCPIHEIELTREQEENWFFRLSTLPGAARAALRRAARLRDATRHYNEARAFIPSGPAGRLALPGPAALGRAGAVGPRATSSTCGSTRS